MAKLGKREAYRKALAEAAALVMCADLEQLFGGDVDEQDEAVLTEAQAKVVRFLNKASGGPAQGKE